MKAVRCLIVVFLVMGLILALCPVGVVSADSSSSNPRLLAINRDEIPQLPPGHPDYSHFAAYFDFCRDLRWSPSAQRLLSGKVIIDPDSFDNRVSTVPIPPDIYWLREDTIIWVGEDGWAYEYGSGGGADPTVRVSGAKTNYFAQCFLVAASPSGSSLVVYSSFGGELWIQGGGGLKIVENGNIYTQAAFSPDESRLVFTVDERLDKTDPYSLSKIKIYTVDLTAEQKILTPQLLWVWETPDYKVFTGEISWSAETNKLLLETGYFLWTIDPETGEATCVLDALEYGIGDAAWCGSRIFYSPFDKNEIYSIDMNGANKTLVLRSSHWIAYFGVSPDGSKLALYDRGSAIVDGIYLLDLTQPYDKEALVKGRLDSDGDGVGDVEEIAAYANPLDPSDQGFWEQPIIWLYLSDWRPTDELPRGSYRLIVNLSDGSIRSAEVEYKVDGETPVPPFPPPSDTKYLRAPYTSDLTNAALYMGYSGQCELRLAEAYEAEGYVDPDTLILSLGPFRIECELLEDWSEEALYEKYGHIDTDGDGLTDLEELYVYGSNHLIPDTDGDGLSDAIEITVFATNPLKVDTDGDGISDGLKAVAIGLSADVEILTEGWIKVKLFWSDYTMSIETSSTVLGVTFDSDSKQLSVNVSGVDGTQGECNIAIPKALVSSSSDVEVHLDGEPIEFTLTEDDAYHHIHVKYHHSLRSLLVSFAPRGTSPTSSEGTSPEGNGAGTTLPDRDPTDAIKPIWMQWWLWTIIGVVVITAITGLALWKGLRMRF